MLPPGQGILLPETSDGRLIFVLGYQDYTLIGTTDVADEPTTRPCPSQEEIDFIVTEVKAILSEYYNFDVNILAAWAGQRPLVLMSEEEVKAEKLTIVD